MLSSSSLYTVLMAATTTLVAAQAVTLTKDGCIDASGFESCQAAVTKKTSACIAQAKKNLSQTELLACGCQDSVDNFNCYSASCWNQVYGCQYQTYMVNYFRTCSIAKQPVPYFPAPDNAAGACSCNLGKVFFAFSAAIQQSTTCINNSQGSADAGSNLQRMQGCSCCEVSGAYSSLIDICPATDPKLIGLSNIATLESASNTQFSQCQNYLQTYDCVNDLGFKLDGVNKFLKPNDALTTGTATLSNAPGTVTAPASGKVFSYTNGGDGVVYTITAAGSGSGSSGSGSGSGSGSSSGSGSGSSSSGSGSGSGSGSSSSSAGSSSASATPTGDSKKNAAVVTTSSGSLVALALALCAVALL